MSSLMQFNGDINKRGVGLQFYRIETENVYPEKEMDTFVCSQCGRIHPRIAVAYRKPKGMCGNWVVFEYNGAEHLPDLSIPISVVKLPKGASVLTDLQSEEIWHSE